MDYKAPPILSKSISYENWLKEIKIWQQFTNLSANKQGPAIFLTLEGKSREAILELDIEKIGSETGVDHVTSKLNTLYSRDKIQTAYESYDRFEKFQRSPDMSISDFIIEFERLLSKTKSYGTTMSSDILAYRVLKSANISEQHEQLARATVADFTYEEMKDKLKKIFGDRSSSSSDFGSVAVKSEPVYEAEHDVLYGQNYGRNSHRGRGRNTRGMAPRAAYRGGGSRGRKGKNPTDSFGNMTKCSVCESINHWASACPDAQYFTELTEVIEDQDHQVTLFESNLITEKCMQIFVAEAACTAILDSGATSTVAGKDWMEAYKESLTPEKQNLIEYSSTSNSFKFGSGKIHASICKAKIPATIGDEEIFIETDVVDSHIPLLLSKASMKKADTEINFKEDSVQMFGCEQQVVVTSSGHYAIPLNRNVKILNDVNHKGAAITLNVSHDPNDKSKTAYKLHCQFSHPHVNKLLDLINKAGMGNDKELIDSLKEVSRNCKVCKVFSRPSALPVVGLPMASEFNEVVAMDIKFLNGKMILHLIDHLSRYSAAAIISSKKPNEIISKIFKVWISVFGPPSKFFSDNGGEFNNQEFRELCERFNITVKTTAAEAPWSNGLCERHNAVLGDMVEKTMAECVMPMETALNWAVHAKNSLSNVHGFSPYQLAIGYTPKLPSVMENKPPAMEPCDSSVSSTIREHLTAMGAARRAFVECENSEKIKRALRHNMTSSSQTKYFTGDSVYYKRADSRKWKGPGKVIGQDGQQVLIKHGGTYVRVHPCRIILEKSGTERPSSGDVKTTLTESSRDVDKPAQSSGGVMYDSEDSDEQGSQDVNSSPLLPDNTEEHTGPVADTAVGASETIRSTHRPGLEQSSQNTMENNDDSLRKKKEIQYRIDNGDWINATLLQRAGKASGKYRGIGTH